MRERFDTIWKKNSAGVTNISTEYNILVKLIHSVVWGNFYLEVILYSRE